MKKMATPTIIVSIGDDEQSVPAPPATVAVLPGRGAAEAAEAGAGAGERKVAAVAADGLAREGKAATAAPAAMPLDGGGDGGDDDKSDANDVLSGVTALGRFSQNIARLITEYAVPFAVEYSAYAPYICIPAARAGTTDWHVMSDAVPAADNKIFVAGREMKGQTLRDTGSSIGVVASTGRSPLAGRQSLVCRWG
jgi:hypothetical protein